MRFHQLRWKLNRAKPHELALVGLAVFMAVVAVGLLAPRLPALMAQASTLGAGPAYSAQIVRVIDGDTVVVASGEHVRVLNIDAAEMPPHSHCALEEHMALAAKARVTELVARAQEITLASAGDRDRDVYGRQLRLIRIDGEDLGARLMREGLAQPWRGHHATWC